MHDNTNRLVTFRLALADGLIRGETSMGDQVSKMTLSPVRSNRVYTFVGRADSAPVLLHKVEPEYTEEARAAKLQGTVLLQVEIEPNGRVSREHLKVARSLGQGLDEKAFEAVRQWTFKPAFQDGKPVATTITIEVNFRL